MAFESAWVTGARRAGTLAVLLMAACAPSTATVSLAVSVAEGPAPPQVTLSVFDPYRALVQQQPIAMPKLPGTLVLYGVSPVELRVALDANENREAGAKVPTYAGQTATADLDLTSALVDSDRDGVPDIIDNCPMAANPDQANARGTGNGDACNGSQPARDLAVHFAADMPPLADLSGVDLTHVTALCPIAGAMLCEDWRVPWDQGQWDQQLSDPPPQVTMSQDPGKTFYGTASLHIHVEPYTNATPYVQANLVSEELPGGSFWIRAYVYMPSTAVPKGASLFEVVDQGHGYGAWNLSLGDGNNLVTFGDGIGHSGKTSATVWPFDRWVCVEWQISESATVGMSSSNVYLDGNELTDLATTTATEYPSDSVRLVLATEEGDTNAPNGTDAWFNQIVYSAARVGCLP